MTESSCTIHGYYRTDDTSGQCPVCKGGGVVGKYCALHGNYEATWANDKLSDCPSCVVNIFAPGTWKCLNCDIHNAGPRVSCWRCGWNTKLGDIRVEPNPELATPAELRHGVWMPEKFVKELIKELREYKLSNKEVSELARAWPDCSAHPKHPQLFDRTADVLEDLLGRVTSEAAVKPPEPPLWELKRLQTEDGKKPRYFNPLFRLDLNGIGDQMALYFAANDSMGDLWDVLQRHFDAQPKTVSTQQQKADEDGGRFETPPILSGNPCECRVYFTWVDGVLVTPPGYRVVNTMQAAKVDCPHCRGTGVVQPRPPSPDPAGVGTLSRPAGLTFCRCGDTVSAHIGGRGACTSCSWCKVFRAE